MLKRALSACLPRMQPTNFSATRLTSTGNSIVQWTNWSVCKGGVTAKTCCLPLPSIWVGFLRNKANKCFVFKTYYKLGSQGRGQISGKTGAWQDSAPYFEFVAKR